MAASPADGLWNRRTLLQVGAAGAGIAAVTRATGAAAVSAPGSLVPQSDFPGVQGLTYLNAAQKHPLNIHVAQAWKDFADFNLRVPDAAGPPYLGMDQAVLAKFAKLIHADPVEVGFVPSTMSAENLIVAALGLPGHGGNVVTDSLHYDGSVYLYQQLAARGLDVRRIEQRDGRIPIEEMHKAIDGNTVLVSVSLVSYANGFHHDLKPVCDAAHAHGALVYADIIQAAGAIPVDVRDSNVDMCAASGHKWMMGDHGLGFLYVRKDLIDGGRLHPTQFGWKQVERDGFRIFRDHPKNGDPVDYHIRPGTVGRFEVGTYALGPMVCLNASLDYIAGIGVAAIRDHASSLAAQLRAELPRHGYECLSPPDAAGHISAFRIADMDAARRKLEKANIRVRLTQDFMRVSVSVFNSGRDIDALISALA